MTRRRSSIPVLLSGAILVIPGCAQLELALRDPSSGSVRAAGSLSQRVVLARFQDPPREEAETPDPPRETGDGADGSGQDSGDRSAEQTDEAAKSGYTSPGLAYQQLAIAVTAAVVSLVDEANEVGRELSESILLSDMGTIGRLGLTAPPTQFAGRVTGRPGLQDGPATGLGFAPPDRNLFAPQFNPLSGANGRCRDLAAAGFYGGSRSACEQSFRK